MSALPLLDMYLAIAREPGAASARSREHLRQVAERLVESALSEHRHLDQLDTAVSPAEAPGTGARAAALMRKLYEQWTCEAEALLQRVTALEHDGVHVGGAEELRHQHGRVRAMLSVTLEDIERGRQQFRDGRWRTIEEVRRELRPGA